MKYGILEYFLSHSTPNSLNCETFSDSVDFNHMRGVMTGTLLWEKSANYIVKLTNIILEKQSSLKNCRCREISKRTIPE